MIASIIKAAAMICAVTLASCGSQDLGDIYGGDSADGRKNEYTQKWIERFGLFDTEHDWTTLRSVEAEIPGEFGPDAVTHIYNAAPVAGGHLIGIAHEPGRLALDLPKGAQSVYATVSDAEGCTLLSGEFAIQGGAVTIAAGQAREPQQSRSAHPVPYFDAMVVCEDLGGIGDYDFNDVVLGLRHVSGTNTLKIMPMAAGGTLHADVCYGEDLIGEIHKLIEPGCDVKTMLNTHSFVKAGKMQSITVPDGFSLSSDWKNIRLVVKDAEATVEIKGPQKSGEAPQMFCLAGDWYWPTETTPVDDSYSGFAAWTTDILNSDWAYTPSDIVKVVTWDVSQVATNWFSGETTTGAPYTVRLNGVTDTDIEVKSGAVYPLDPPASLAGMFQNGSSLTKLDVAASHFDTEYITSLSNTFYGCSNLTSLDLSDWNTGVVTTMYNMFNGCSGLKTLNLSGMSTANVTNVSGMFDGCTSLESLDISGWNISRMSIPTDIFRSCGHLTTVTMDKWTDSSTKSKLQTFLKALPESVESLVMKECDFSKSTDLGTLFNTLKIKELDVTGWTFPASGFKLSSAFNSCSNLTAIVGLDTWDVSHVTEMTSMFNYCPSLTSIDISKWDTSAVTSMLSMFSRCSSLTSLNLSTMNTANVSRISTMFDGCSSLESLDLSNWDISRMSGTTDVFRGCTSLKTVTMNNWTDTRTEKSDLRKILESLPESTTTLVMRDCKFPNAKDLGADIDRNTHRSVFENCKWLTSIDVTGWETPSLTSLRLAFASCANLQEIIGLGTWDVSQVTTLSGLFSGCKSLAKVDIYGWDISKVSVFTSMFSGCPANMTIRCSAATRQILEEKAHSYLPANVQWDIPDQPANP